MASIWETLGTGLDSQLQLSAISTSVISKEDTLQWNVYSQKLCCHRQEKFWRLSQAMSSLAIDAIFPVAINMATLGSVLLGQSLSDDSQDTTLFLNSSPFPNDQNLWCDPSLSWGLLNLGSIGYFGQRRREVHVNCFVCMLNTCVLGEEVHLFSSKDDET